MDEPLSQLNHLRGHVLWQEADRQTEAPNLAALAGLFTSPSPSPRPASAPVHRSQPLKCLGHPRDLKKSPSFSPS